MKKKYYEAYDERYKTIHQNGLLWFSKNVTPELLEWVEFHKIPKDETIAEIGCGEGRDAFHLAKLGYQVMGFDISQEAIKKCREIANAENVNCEFMQVDATEPKEIPSKYKYIYSIATLHMLVLDEDRKKFLKSIYNLLEPQGKCLLVNLGDGLTNRKSNIDDAFNLEVRHHMQTNQDFMVASTSFRGVDFESHVLELTEAGFEILDKKITSNEEYHTCMTMYLQKK